MAIEGTIPPKRGTARDKQAYSVWQGILSRCYRESNISFPRYGGVGVIVSDEWKDFRVFEEWYLKERGKFPVGTELQVDKDLLSEGIGKYSSETCVLLPRAINVNISWDGQGLSVSNLYRVMCLCYEFKECLDSRVFQAVAKILKEHDTYLVNSDSEVFSTYREYLRYFTNTRVSRAPTSSGFFEADYS